MIPAEWILQAAERISGIAVKTPTTFDVKRNIYLKWENKQITGSFKVRGALNKILSLTQWEREQGLVTASAGNHGQGVALAASQTDAKVIVFASQNAPPVKINAMHTLGAEIRLVDGGYAEAESAAISFAEATGKTWVSPYNDGLLIAGQATVGLELIKQVPPSIIKSIIVPVGGGGLISGIGAGLSRLPDRPKLIGVQSEASAFMFALFHNKSQNEVVENSSIADGLAGYVEEGAITIPMVRKYVDEFILVTEQAIEKAMCYAWEAYGEKIEGSAAVGLAAVLSSKVRDLPAALILTGGNVQPELHEIICKRWAGISMEDGRA
jgi:threonine dehydratase